MRSSSPLLPQALLARVMLALLLLFAQQQAATHWLSHVAEAKQLEDAMRSELPNRDG